MKICVLSSPPDKDDIPYDPSSYFTQYQWEHFIPSPTHYKTEIDQLIAYGIDIFVNLCDGTPDDELSGIGLVKYLEERGVAFTGANSKFFDPTRLEMKQAALEANIPTPGSLFLDQISNLADDVCNLHYPLLVKPPHGYASVGISKDSRVDNRPELITQLGITISRFGSALIEEFVEGREFTTLVAENANDPGNPVTFSPVEFNFPPGESFKHYDMKWKEYDLMSVTQVVDARISNELQNLTKRQFLAMNGVGYARCDFRMGQDGVFYLLEINPNCGIFYPPHEPGSADFILLNDPRGHSSFLKLILSAALRRKSQAREILNISSS